jgi:hypothetical protein
MMIKKIISLILIACLSQSFAMEENPNRKLLRACRSGNIQLAKEALDSGANINEDFLIHRPGANININYENTQIYITVLSIAAERSYLSLAQFLIARGADINAHESQALNRLIYKGGRVSPKMVELLVASGADLTVRNSYDRTPLEQAQKSFLAAKIVQILQNNLQHPTVEYLNKHILLGNYNMVKKLLESGNIKPTRAEFITATQAEQKAIAHLLYEYIATAQIGQLRDLPQDITGYINTFLN